MSAKYKRVLLKLSGEALMGDQPYGISPDFMDKVVVELSKARDQGVQLGLVVGGGNIFRGVSGAASGMNRASADQMGMLATVINSLALQDALERKGVPARVLSAIEVGRMAETFVRARAIKHLERGRVVIFAAGTGNPFFTTDTAAALRALEIEAEILFKATRVDGVYDKDPYENQDAKRIPRITYSEVLERGLRVMDGAAIALAKDAGLPVMVFNMLKEGNILKAVAGEDIGSLIVAD
ncbi:MAG: UMP kinase [Thermodesulfobacteria bacterium]|nr:UMP kinase [Thermodesulfobacteriota bacterium]